MAWSDIFTKQPEQKPANQQQQPNNQQQQNNQGNQGNQPQGGNGQPNLANQNTQNNQPQDPLAIYAKMFDNPGQEADKPPTFSLKKETMDQVVSSQDFTQGIDPALMQKATSGDAQAMIELMQNVGRNAYRASLEHGGVLTDKFVGAYNDYSSKQLPSTLKGHMTEQALGANTPNFKNPVVRQQLTEVAKRLQRQHPDAQPQEIADMAKDYITQLASALNPTTSPESDPKKKDVNWEEFFSDDQGN